jgi:hypothetical protein
LGATIIHTSFKQGRSLQWVQFQPLIARENIFAPPNFFVIRGAILCLQNPQNFLQGTLHGLFENDVISAGLTSLDKLHPQITRAGYGPAFKRMTRYLTNGFFFLLLVTDSRSLHLGNFSL